MKAPIGSRLPPPFRLARLLAGSAILTREPPRQYSTNVPGGSEGVEICALDKQAAPEGAGGALRASVPHPNDGVSASAEGASETKQQ